MIFLGEGRGGKKGNLCKLGDFYYRVVESETKWKVFRQGQSGYLGCG